MCSAGLRGLYPLAANKQVVPAMQHPLTRQLVALHVQERQLRHRGCVAPAAGQSACQLVVPKVQIHQAGAGPVGRQRAIKAVAAHIDPLCRQGQQATRQWRA